MASIPSYLSWVPVSGKGNTSITIKSAVPYKGRLNRTTNISGKVVGKSNSVTVTVVEEAHWEYMNPDSLAISASKAGGTIHITGKSNTPVIRFDWSDNFGIADVTTYLVNGSITATNNVAITGDPGASGEFTFDATLVIPANDTPVVREALLDIYSGMDTSDLNTVSITQALGDSYLYINSQGTTTASVTIPQNGTAKTINVLSNDSWIFEAV